jgi:hypothetical protein
MLLQRVRGSGGVCLTALRHRVPPFQHRLRTCLASRLLQLIAASSVSYSSTVVYCLLLLLVVGWQQSEILVLIVVVLQQSSGVLPCTKQYV